MGTVDTAAGGGRAKRWRGGRVEWCKGEEFEGRMVAHSGGASVMTGMFELMVKKRKVKR